MSAVEFSVKDHAFFDLINPQYISWEFYSEYLDKEPPFGDLGAIIYLRTYSRFVNELKRREIWQETVLRNIEYSLSLDTVMPFADKRTEAKALFNMMFNLQGFPAGRSLWTAGSPQTKKDSSSNWNCTFKTVNSLSAFSEIFYWLLIGAGTGFSVEQKYISQLPEFNTKIHVIHETYNYQKRLDGTFVNLVDSESIPQFLTTYTDFVETSEIIKADAEFVRPLEDNHKIVRLQIGDSKEDWCNALRIFLKALTNKSVEKIYINYDPIRPAGTPIKTFGGRASGHKALLEMFDNFIKIIRRCNGQLDSVGVLDIVNSIGLNVVSGGVRRTAQLALGDSSDEAFKTAKVGLFDDPEKADYKAIRTMSNNSTGEYDHPGLDAINQTFECLETQGDPGFWIIGNSQRLATSPVKGTNPCGEAALDDCQSCNLTTKNVKACIFFDSKANKWEYDWDLGKKTIELITRLGTRITLANQWHPEWDKTQKRDRLLGVSMTGVMDAFDLLGWDYEQQKHFFQWCKQTAIQAADDYHAYLGINKSARVCLMKPEGTISLLPTVSSGIHRAYAPYYLRRVRFSKSDPLAQVLLNLGLKPVPENGQGDDLFSDDCNTWVFTFPIKTNAKIRAIDEPITEQLERYRLAQTNYADRGHNISCFSSDTRFITKQGVVSFGSLEVGSSVEVINGEGKWSSATVIKTDEPVPMFELTLKNVNNSKTANIVKINSTFNHKWNITRNHGRPDTKVMQTKDLKEGYKINSLFLTDFDHLDEEGIRHGIVFGDGSLTSKKTASQLYLCAEKRELTRYFDGYSINERDDINQTRIYGLPLHYKELPGVSVNNSYLLGFVAGLLATDGNICKGTTTICTTQVTVVDFLLNISPKLGLSISNVYKFPGGAFTKEGTVGYQITFRKPSIPEHLILRSKHRDHFNPTAFSKKWEILSVKAIEDDYGYCVEEPDTHQFALEHNIHTWNCTITVAPDEYKIAANWVNDNWDDIIGIAFLPRFDPVEGGKAAYPLMPLEPCDQETYEVLKAQLPILSQAEIITKLSEIEKGFEQQELDKECFTGACPVR